MRQKLNRKYRVTELTIDEALTLIQSRLSLRRGADEDSFLDLIDEIKYKLTYEGEGTALSHTVPLYLEDNTPE